MLHVYFSNKFKKDYKRMIKRGVRKDDIEYVINELRNERTLPEKYYDHSLEGEYKGFRECHINPDWLLIYQIENEKLKLTLSRTGTHSDLF
ncbi:MAG: type II toxin-antitoxin system YafQ family toxin [Candidatus Ornithomonoglobus sp.]